MQEEFKKHLSDNLEVTLRLLTGVLSRRDNEPTWLYQIVGHPLLDTILRQLTVRELFSVAYENEIVAFMHLNNIDPKSSPSQNEKSKHNLPLGIAFFSMILPIAPVRLQGYLEDLFGLLSHAVTTFVEQGR